MQMFWNKRNHLHKKRVHLQRDWFGTPTWPPFHCFGTPIWPTWRHVKTHYKQFGFCGPEQKLDEGTITAAGYSGKVHFCYPAGYRNTGSVHGNFSVLLAKFVKRGRFERKVFWGTRFGCIWSGKALRGNAYFSSLIAKENASYSFTVHEVVTVLYATRFQGLDAILDRPGTLCLDLMCSVFLARELVSILWHSFTDETLAIFCLPQVCLWFFSQFSIKFFIVRKFPF